MTVNEIRQTAEPICRRHRVRRLDLFGSRARGDAKANSDIDLMVVADEIRLEGLFEVLAPVEELLDRPISPTLLSNKEFAKRRESDGSFVARVLSGPTIALIGSVDAA